MKSTRINLWNLVKLALSLVVIAGLSFPVAQLKAAATKVTSEPYVTDFEFHDNGLYYWGNTTGPGCGGEFSPVSTMGILANRGPKYKDAGGFNPILIGESRNFWSPCGPMLPLGMARTDDSIFVCDFKGVSRFPAYVPPFASVPSPQAIGNRFNMDYPGAMLVVQDQLYFVASFSSPVAEGNTPLGRFQVYSLPATNATLLTPVSLIAHGGGMTDVSLGRVKKFRTMTVQRASPLGFDVDVEVGLILGDSGALVRFDMYPNILFGRVPRLLANNVADFDVRNESHVSGGFIQFRDYLYAAVNDSPVINEFSCGENGRLVQMDAGTGAQTQIWPRGGDNYGRIQITGVELDNDYIFVNTRSVSGPFPPFGGCATGQAVIRSKRSRAYITLLGGGPAYPDPDYQAIELHGGSNLRSDNHWLYFTRSNAIWRITNAAPPLQLDFAAVGLEAVQVIQDMFHSVRLVEGKRTVVRGYAREVVNTTGNANWRPAGELRGWLNGVELPGSPMRSDTSPALLVTTDLAPHRSSTTNNYLFELPREWVRAGTLQLQFNVNPGGFVYESGANPFANNLSAVASVTVVRVARPAFVFAALKTVDAPNYWPWEHQVDFNNMLARATAMLPVPSIDVRFTTEQVSDVEFIGDCGLFCHDPFDFSKDADWNEALEELACYDNFDRPPPGASRGHFVGGIHPNAATKWGGLAYTPGSHMLVKMDPVDLNDTFNMFWGGRTLAHEFGHNLGREHVNQLRDNMSCGGNAPANPDSSYPFNSCTFGSTNPAFLSSPVGFDMVSYKPVLPAQGGDLLSYAPERWPSTWTYNAMLDALSPAPAALVAAGAPPSGPYLLVRGLLNFATRTARLKPCYSLEEGMIAPEKIQSSFDAATHQHHDYKLRQLDAADGLLEEVPLVIRESEDGDGTTSLINQFLVKQPGVARVQVLKGTAVLAELRASANEPAITGVSVTHDPVGQTLGIGITAADADGDALSHTIQFSNDDGVSWRMLRANSRLAVFIADARRLPGGAQCRVRVITTDGFHSTVAVSEPFAIERRAPEILTGGLRDGQRVPYGANVEVKALAVDAEDGSLPDQGTTWSIAGPTPLTTTSGSFNTRKLSPGTYTATATSTDTDGSVTVSTVYFEVLPLVVNEASAPILDGDVADSAYASASPVPIGNGGTARFTHQGGFLYASFSGLGYGGGGNEAAVGLRIDADASGDATAQPGDRGFFVDENGVSWQLAGDGAAMVAPAVPPGGLKAVVSRGPGGWSAEFRIAEGLVGGWEHPARLSVEVDGAACISLIFGEVCFPTVGYWPVTTQPNDPSTWVEVYFGTPPPPVNQPPVAIVSSNIVADLGTKVFLDGANSYDPDGNPITYSWTRIDGSPVALTGADTATPSFTLPAGEGPVNLWFRLIVSDGALESLAADVLVVGNPIVLSPLPSITSGVVVGDGTASGQIVWPGRTGDRVVVQASSDMETWEDLLTVTVGDIPMILFTDADAALYPYRFYRATTAPSGLTQQAGNALLLDGAGARVDVPHEDSLNALPITISAWIRTTQSAGAYPGIVTKYTGGGALGYALGLDAGRLSAWYYVDGANYLWDGAAGLDSRFVADGVWHHVAYVVDESSGRIYIDGLLVDTHLWVGSPGVVASTEALRFGAYLGGSGMPFAGEIDDVSIWNKALTGVEVLDLKNISPQGDEPSLLGLWRFDEEDMDGPATGDSSGHDRPGTLINNAVRVPSSAPVKR